MGRCEGPPGTAAHEVRHHVVLVDRLRLPCDQAVLDLDVPRAGAGAVHAVGGPDDLVVLPAVPVEGLPAAVLGDELAPAVGRGGSAQEELVGLEKRAARSGGHVVPDGRTSVRAKSSATSRPGRGPAGHAVATTHSRKACRWLAAGRFNVTCGPRPGSVLAKGSGPAVGRTFGRCSGG